MLLREPDSSKLREATRAGGLLASMKEGRLVMPRPSRQHQKWCNAENTSGSVSIARHMYTYPMRGGGGGRRGGEGCTIQSRLAARVRQGSSKAVGDPPGS